MIKFKGENADGRPLLGIGLSEGNLELLRMGKPISFSGDEVQMPGFDVLILYGKTEEDIAKELDSFGKD